jgi:GTP pyrophosphokinase
MFAGRLDYDQVVLAAVAVLPCADLTQLVDFCVNKGVLSEDEAGAVFSGGDPEACRELLQTRLQEHLRDQEPDDVPLTIEGVRHPVPVHMARCCRPEYGEEVVAYATRNRGATIHRRTCRRVRPMVALKRWPVHLSRAWWRGAPPVELTRFDIRGKDRRGLLVTVASALNEIRVGVQALELVSDPDGAVRGFVRVQLKGLTERAEVARRLQSIPGITTVRWRGSSSR